MKGLLTSTMTSLMFAMILTTPAWAEPSFATLKGIPAEAMTVHDGRSAEGFSTLTGIPAEPMTASEMDAVEGKYYFSYKVAIDTQPMPSYGCWVCGTTLPVPDYPVWYSWYSR